ncbi:MAG TPA: glycosyltransferase family 4 protein [Gemmatimonadaceae bacterium]|nr:glycosyltransferase family 4 protein [Gemmatimonadaceae bacterium]
MTRVLHWICDAPSPYNSFLFRTLAATPGIELLVHFRRLGVASHPWTQSLLEGFESREIASGSPIDPVVIRAAMASQGTALVVGGWYDLTLQSVLTLARAPFAVWTDTPDRTADRSAPKRALRDAWLRHVLPRATRVYGTGEPALDALHAMGAPRDRLQNFPYWIDLAQYGEGTTSPPGTALTIMSSGRLAGVKGYDIGLEALATAFRDARVPFRWQVAGTGEDAPLLKAQADRLGIGAHVQWLGWTQPDTLPRLYQEADIFLHPARWEPYGVVVLEAMASGLPVLASRRTSAALDRVTDGVNGLLHDVGDVATLASQLRWCDGHRDAVATMRRAARTTAHEWPIDRAVHIIRDFLAALD